MLHLHPPCIGNPEDPLHRDVQDGHEDQEQKNPDDVRTPESGDGSRTYVLEQVGRAEDSFTRQVVEDVRIVVTSAMSEDKVVIGLPEAATLFRHTSGLEVRTSNGYGTHFGIGLVLARGKVRSAVTFEPSLGDRRAAPRQLIASAAWQALL